MSYGIYAHEPASEWWFLAAVAKDELTAQRCMRALRLEGFEASSDYDDADPHEFPTAMSRQWIVW